MIKQAYQVNELNKGYNRQQYKGSTDRKELSLWEYTCKPFTFSYWRILNLLLFSLPWFSAYGTFSTLTMFLVLLYIEFSFSIPFYSWDITKIKQGPKPILCLYGTFSELYH